MKQPVYISAHNAITPLGFSTKETFTEMLKGNSGLRQISDTSILPVPFCAGMIDEVAIDENFQALGNPKEFTKLEKMLLLSATETVAISEEKITAKTGIILATTKGNIDLLDTENNIPQEQVYLSSLAKTVADFLHINTEPIIISNACVSGILAVAVAQRMLQTNAYDNFLIVAGDLVTRFTISGFHSFQALSDTPCQPYSKDRKGINLGEAATSVWISKHRPAINAIQVLGGASCNDANHISGPSRTGEGLKKSVQSAMEEASISVNEIDFISAHGTATQYNDEMEAQAFNALKMQDIPLHSLKGYFGHTLGASGLLETVLSMESMFQQKMIPSFGFDKTGITKSLNVIKEVSDMPIENPKNKMKTFLKTASGFGGCNTAVLFKKLS